MVPIVALCAFDDAAAKARAIAVVESTLRGFDVKGPYRAATAKRPSFIPSEGWIVSVKAGEFRYVGGVQRDGRLVYLWRDDFNVDRTPCDPLTPETTERLLRWTRYVDLPWPVRLVGTSRSRHETAGRILFQGIVDGYPFLDPEVGPTAAFTLRDGVFLAFLVKEWMLRRGPSGPVISEAEARAALKPQRFRLDGLVLLSPADGAAKLGWWVGGEDSTAHLAYSIPYHGYWAPRTAAPPPDFRPQPTLLRVPVDALTGKPIIRGSFPVLGSVFRRT